LLGIFLRKTFAHINAIHVVPGPFSIYRKKFFEKYGEFDENNLTEDTEMGLRIQSKGYKIENCIDARVETVTPKTFYDLLKQRRRWYGGFIDNALKYKQLLNPKYGYLGLLVLPSAFISVSLGLAYVIYVCIKNFDSLKHSLERWSVLGFAALSPKNFEFVAFKEAVFNFFVNPLLPLIVISLMLMLAMIFSAKKFSKEKYNLSIGLFYFFIFYSFIYALWWCVAIIYKTLNRNITWR
jgi:cellulose synthase/poly-beta-1,6-N-acetylglucosamine synthase-like glycosyltransferase